MISSNDLRNGVTILVDGNLWTVIEFLHVKPGKGSAFVRTRLKNVKTGTTLERTFRASFRWCSLEDPLTSGRTDRQLRPGREGRRPVQMRHDPIVETSTRNEPRIKGVEFIQHGHDRTGGVAERREFAERGVGGHRNLKQPTRRPKDRNRRLV